MYNKIQLMGRLTCAPVLKTSQNGVPYTNFRIAVNRRFHAKGEETKTDFFNVIAWRTTAEFICKYFGRGNMIMLDGSLQTEPYIDKNGNNTIWHSVVVDSVSFTGEPKRDNGGGSNYGRSSGGYNQPNSSRPNYGGRNMFEQAQQIYGKPPSDNGYGGNGSNGVFTDEPLIEDYPF